MSQVTGSDGTIVLVIMNNLVKKKWAEVIKLSKKERQNCVHMYPGFILIRCEDTEMIVMKEEVYTHRAPEAEYTASHTGPGEEAPGSVRRQKE